ncbi:MAG: AMP-binding protein, partial [Sedimentisphaerales bacterium]|nr:AMP-binding protein [Sedimentisphaerales bacterium]
ADPVSGVLTYRDLVRGIYILRNRIRAFPGEYVGIMMPASVGVGVMYLAAIFSGKVPVMINWTLGAKMLLHTVESVPVGRILTSRRLVERLREQGYAIEELADRFVFAEDIRKQVGLAEKLRAYLAGRFIGRFAGRSLAVQRLPETAVILFTSGSESHPKAVPLTHGNLLTNLGDIFACLKFRAGDVLLGFLPPFHSFGLTVTVLLPLCFGIRAVYYPNPTHGRSLGGIIEAYRVTILVSAATFLDGILRHAAGDRLASARLVITGAERCPPRLYDALAARCSGALLLEGYGVTEASPVISVNDENDPRPGTIGKVLKSVEYAVVDEETGRAAGVDQPGMLLVRGPSIFSGYRDYDGPSPFVEFEGRMWYRTGDVVRRDDQGILTFVARERRFIKRGGEMISLPAIESVLDKHFHDDREGPQLAVTAADGDHHPEIVVFTTGNLDKHRLNQVIRLEGLSGLHSVRRVVRLKEMPLLGPGKTDYRALAETLKNKTNRPTSSFGQ